MFMLGPFPNGHRLSLWRIPSATGKSSLFGTRRALLSLGHKPAGNHHGWNRRDRQADLFSEYDKEEDHPAVAFEKRCHGTLESAKGERKSLDATVEEFDLDRAVDDEPSLANELVKALLTGYPVALLVHIDAA